MKPSKLSAFIAIGLLAILLASIFSSCSSTRPQSRWMDLPHARQLDKNKGKQLKHIQSHTAKVYKY